MDAKIQKIVSSMIVLTLCLSFLSSVLTPRIVKADPGWDFVIDTLTSDKLSYNWGEQAQIWVGITNTGTQKIGNNLARADFEVISPQGQTVFTGQDWLGYDINPGAGWVFDTWWTIPTNMATGYYSIKVTITVWETSYQSPTHVKTKEVDNYFLVAGSSSPTPSVSPTSLDFGTSDTQKSFSITNTGGGTLTWSLSSSQSWLSVTPSSGSGNANIAVNVNRSGLSSGSYNGVITVNSNNGILAVSVTMQIPVLTQSWDFVIGTLTSDKLSYNWGEQAQIWAAITNTGSEKISNNYARADFEIISPQGQTVFTGQDWLGYDINPGAGWILDTHWTIPSDAAIGSYSIRVTVTIWEGINGQWQGATHVKTKEVDNSFSVAGSSSPTPSVSPTSLDFGTSDTQKSFSITNTGGGTLTWSLSSSQSWLSVTPSSGSGNANIAVNVNRSGLSSGSYNGVITVNSNNGILAVSVTMQIPVLTQDPVLSVSPTSLDFGTSDTQKSFNIVNAGGGTLIWSISSNQAWLTVSPTSGSGSASIGVMVNRSGLNSETYSGIIMVNSNGGTSTVSISMQVATESVDKTINVLYQGSLYTIDITVPVSKYQDVTNAAQSLASQYPNVDSNLLAESIYLYHYVNDSTNYPIFKVAIYQSNQPVNDTNLKSQILDGLLTNCFLLIDIGSSRQISLFQTWGQQCNEDYQDSANTVRISDALAYVTGLLTKTGQIFDVITNMFGGTTSQQVSEMASLVVDLYQGTQSLRDEYRDQKTESIISILKENNLIETSTEDYNPAQLYQAFTANPSAAAQALSEISEKVFNVNITEDAKSIISAGFDKLSSAAMGSFTYGASMGLYAYFCSQLTASTAAQIGASAAFSHFTGPGLLFSLADVIQKSYILPMANALHDAWEAEGDAAVYYMQLSLDAQSMANPAMTANAFDITIAHELASVYGMLDISQFLYYANSYQYKDGQIFGRNELPGLKSSADMALANAQAWQATLQQIQSQASALANSADPDSVSFDFLFPTPSNYLPTMPLADGFAVVTDSSNALLSVGDYSFTVQNGKWSSNFTHSFYVSDAKGSSYLVVADSPTGEASIQTEQGTDISVLSYDTSEPGIISVSQEIAQSTPEVSQEIAQSSTSAFLVSNTAGTVTVMPAPLTITTTSLSNGYVGSTYSAILAASGGNGTRAWLAMSGTLPDGLSLNPSTGVISGTPTSSGVFDFTVQVSDNVASTTKALSITTMIRHRVNWWLIGGIIAAVALIGGGVGLLVRRRTRKA